MQLFGLLGNEAQNRVTGDALPMSSSYPSGKVLLYDAMASIELCTVSMRLNTFCRGALGFIKK